MAQTTESNEAHAVKYCEDCALYRAAPDGNPSYARCTFPPAQSGLALVARNAIRLRVCEAERRTVKHADSCGPEAKWFKPKEITE